MRMANEPKLNTPPFCGISSPDVTNGSATSKAANATQAKHSRW